MTRLEIAGAERKRVEVIRNDVYRRLIAARRSAIRINDEYTRVVAVLRGVAIEEAAAATEETA